MNRHLYYKKTREEEGGGGGKEKIEGKLQNNMVSPLIPLMAISFYSKCFQAKRGNWDVHSYSRKKKVYSTEYNCNMHNFLQQIPIARPLHFCTLKVHKFKYPKLRLVHLVLRQAASPSRFLENLPHVSAGLEVTMAEFMNGEKPEFYGIWSSAAFRETEPCLRCPLSSASFYLYPLFRRHLISLSWSHMASLSCISDHESYD